VGGGRVTEAAVARPDASVLESCHANLVEAAQRVARSRPGGRTEEEDGVVRVASGVSLPNFNPVFVTKVPHDPAGLVDRSARFMHEAKVVRWSIVAPDPIRRALHSFPEATGLTRRRRVPGLLMDPVPSSPPQPPPGLRIRPANTPALWEQMVLTGFEAMSGLAPESPAAELPYGLSRTVRGYVGFVDSSPVATSLGVVHRGVCGVYFSATLPEHRGRGFGTAMTWRAVVDGRAEGAKVAYILANEVGLPVCTAMGFRKVAEYTTWRAP
jgi:GNAT superfamily N-acetyltransferase